jgi:hypothetical protein
MQSQMKLSCNVGAVAHAKLSDGRSGIFDFRPLDLFLSIIGGVIYKEELS